MKSIGAVFARMFGQTPLTPEESRRKAIYREWSRQRAAAFTPSQRAEIDAIFSRGLD